VGRLFVGSSPPSGFKGAPSNGWVLRMTIAPCHVASEGVLLGADSTTTIYAPLDPLDGEHDSCLGPESLSSFLIVELGAQRGRPQDGGAGWRSSIPRGRQVGRAGRQGGPYAGQNRQNAGPRRQKDPRSSIKTPEDHEDQAKKPATPGIVTYIAQQCRGSRHLAPYVGQTTARSLRKRDG